MTINSTQLALIFVSALLLLFISRWAYVTLEGSRSEKRRAEMMLKQVESDATRETSALYNRQIQAVISGMENVNQRQVRLIEDLTERISALLRQLDSDSLIHLAKELASAEKNKQLHDEIEESKH